MLTGQPDWEQVFQDAEWGVVISSPDGISLGPMNSAFARMHGFTPEELMGQPIATVFAPHCRAELEDHIQRTHHDGRNIFESEHIRKDGSVFPVQVDATAIRDTEGRVLYRAVYVQDITERRRAEQALQESAALGRERLAELELIYATAPVGLCLHDCAGRILKINRRLADIDGLSVEAHLGRTIRDLLPHVAERIEPHIQQVIASGQPVLDVEISTQTPARSSIVALVSFHPLKRADGQVRAVSVVVQDITSRKHAEEALQRSHNLLRGVIENTSDVVFVKGADGRYLMMNSAGVRLMGRPLVEILGTDDSELFPPDLAERLRADDLRVLAGQEVQEFAQIVPAQGEARIVMTKKCAWIDEQERIVGVIGIARDVTERQRAEEAVQRSHNLLQGVIESTSDVVFVKGADGRYLMMNSAGMRIVDRPASEILGRNDLELFPRDLAERFQSDDRRVLAGEEVQQIEQVVPAQGEARILLTKKCAWVDEQGRIMGVIGIARDVTEHRWAEQELSRLRAENVYLREEMDSGLEAGDIVGRSRGIREVLSAVKQVAVTDSTVLITGETGTGKELIANAIHGRSRRKDHILVRVNCAALPAGLIESELFGHEKGAFTGALSRRIGRFESAHRGTLFLDEIGDLPLELQAKLLRVLQEGEFERVGGAEPLRVDVRVVAATNRDLALDVERGRFRADLYYRLNVFPIALPPLRERAEDIPLLAQHVAMKHAARMGKRIERISAAALAALSAYPWPGNVRELQNVIERGVILCQGSELDIGPWLPTVALAPPERRTPTLEALERGHILAVLEQTRWRVSGQRGAARILGIKPTTLEARMKRLGIQRPT